MLQLSKEDIKKYSELFKQPISIVELFASTCDNLTEFKKKLYYFDDEEIEKYEENVGEDSNDEYSDKDEMEQIIENKISEFLDTMAENLAKEMGIPVEEVKENAKIVKLNPNLTLHMCPFTDGQKEKIDCSFCPLHLQNFVPTMFNMARKYNISFEEAAESIKFHSYRNYEDTYKKIISEMEKYKSKK